ncbi:MAG: methyltransferase domain-containing protein [Dolichospermum sp. DET50]|nr:methyltransferase domain-containing protein [Dolichospermum sp. DET66]MBS3035100.1 methyltransferase domain-containing protein [Dolichospermum sp. DET67]MBS3040300.1 methyltransferase domain-containing protein [Dolichospermum sp. DET50]QSX67457.1 MAG: methyltransferase domain-containing protein [Dolichospermum sp. DET69]
MKTIANNKRTLLNLGCGQTRPDNWINTDCSLNSLLQKMQLISFILTKLYNRTSYSSSNAIYMDLNKRWKFTSDSVDVVYASHVFEHLTLVTAKLFIQEAYRVIKPSGVIRIIVPDLYKLSKDYIQKYETGEQDAYKELLYSLNLHQEGTYSTDRNFLEKFFNLIQGYPHQHKYMYDSLSLRKIISDAGFINICDSSYAVSSYIPEIHEVEFTKEGIPSIYIEAIKPVN